MARIRQQFPQNYGSSGNINEFESLIRYLNSAELGNKTVGELLAKLFDADGNFDGLIELRKAQAETFSTVLANTPTLQTAGSRS